jgi:hypothetical protein
MKKLSLVLLVLLAAIALSIISVFAQTSLSSWPYFVELTPRAGTSGTNDIVVPLQVLDKAREDLADLRLYDTHGQEIPYAVRIRTEVDDKREVAVSVFNQATSGSTSSEMSVDLGENPGEHNEVEVVTAGANFRRRVDLDGSDSGKEWRTLRSGEMVFNFVAQNSTVESNRVNYPTSRYRYLRVRAFADELTDKGAPTITDVKVVMAVRQKGELSSWSVPVLPYQLLRNQGALASAWALDLGGRVPCDRLTIEVDNVSFSRPFQLEDMDDPQNVRLLASGELTRRVGEQIQPLVITFDHEEYVQKLRLRIIDYSNQTLSLTSVTAAAPARQLIFDLKKADGQPLRLYFGNRNGTAPHYDFEKEIAAKATKSVARSEVGYAIKNPDYKPEPLPLTERIPWLIYLVLAASSIALALILISLARTTLRTEPEQGEGSEVEAGG